jgi:hypothetical protein
VPSGAHPILDPQPSPLGNLLAFVSDSEIYVANLSGVLQRFSKRMTLPVQRFDSRTRFTVLDHLHFAPKMLIRLEIFLNAKPRLVVVGLSSLHAESYCIFTTFIDLPPHLFAYNI